MTRARTLILILLAWCLVGSVQAQCPSDDVMGAMAADMLAVRPVTVPALTRMEDGYCAQRKLVALLQPHWGGPIGYKAGLTSQAAQARFGVREPVRGVLLGGMMLAPDALVRADFAVRPLLEADLIAVVGNAAINQAHSHQEVMAHLSALRPFIELADGMVADPQGLSGAQIAAINVGARKGVLGEAIPVEEDAGLAEALATMSVRVTDQEGEILTSATGASILGHPLNAVLWLRDSGVELREGDLLSLGAFGGLLTPKPGLVATVSYEGLPGTPRLRVRFE